MSSAAVRKRAGHIATDDEIDRTLLVIAISHKTRPRDRREAIAELRRVAHTGGPTAILLSLVEDILRRAPARKRVGQ